MTYLKEKNKRSVQIGCFWVFFFVLIASLGTDVAVLLISAAQVPQEGETVNLWFAQVDQKVFSEFIGGGLGLMMFGFIAHLLINSIDGKAKLGLVNWPFRNVTEDLEGFVRKKGYSDHSQLSNLFPEAFSYHNEPSERARAWFGQIYMPVRDATSVLGANKEFLYWREIYCFSVILLVLYLGALLLSGIFDWYFLKWPGLAAAFTCLLLLKLAARNASNTLVRNSLSESLNKP
ncbi:MAG: hypothetical protein QM504_11565 [Pseudomonadota bacterium]